MKRFLLPMVTVLGLLLAVVWGLSAALHRIPAATAQAAPVPLQTTPVTLSIQPPASTQEVGDVFELTIQIEAGSTQVLGVDAFLDFAPGIIQAQAITGTPLLPQVLYPGPWLDNTSGMITYSLAAPPFSPYPTGTFTFATIRFQATGAGTANITFSMAPRRTTTVIDGSTFMPAPIAVQNGSVTILAGPTPTPTPTPTETPTATPVPVVGRMTGGGHISMGKGKAALHVSHGFTLHCDASQGTNNLQVNWNKGENEKFHLESLTSALCSDDPSIDEGKPVARFDTYVGSGTGRYNGVSGATINFMFTDAGEPGRSDILDIIIVAPDSTVVLSVSGSLSGGNHQAHEYE